MTNASLGSLSKAQRQILAFCKGPAQGAWVHVPELLGSRLLDGEADSQTAIALLIAAGMIEFNPRLKGIRVTQAGKDWKDSDGFWPHDGEAGRLARAVLLFHGNQNWGSTERALWWALTGTDEATTRELCNMARRTLVSSWVPADGQAPSDV